MAMGSTQPVVKMSTRNIPGGKGGWCLRMATSPPSCAECHKIWEPKPSGILWACYETPFTTTTSTTTVIAGIIDDDEKFCSFNVKISPNVYTMKLLNVLWMI